MSGCVILSGCSGGGKSTLLAELRQRGYPVMEEAGRRIVQAQTRSHGAALPWRDMHAFLRLAITTAQQDHATAQGDSAPWVFFDRSVIDAAAAWQALTGEPTLTRVAQIPRYHRQVFLAPPWPEIYVQDEARRHALSAATEEFERLAHVYPTLGYDVTLLPKVSVEQRADFVLNTLAAR